MNRLTAPFSFLKFLLSCLFIFCAAVIHAQSTGDTVRTDNLRSEVVNGKIVLHYDLLGPADKRLNIGIVLLSREDLAYSYMPVAVSGDVGTVVTAGHDKQILWDISREFPQGLDTGKYFFRVDAEPVKGGINPWVLAGGAAIIAGSVALILSLKSSGSTPVNLELPDPIGRPNR